MISGLAYLLGKVLAGIAYSTAFLSNFTGCVMFFNQPKMTEKVRMMKK